jgi:protein TonB
LLSRVEPDFPTEALRAGVERGTVKARLTLDGTGQVTRVDIVEANPRRIFDRAVTRALSQWRYSEGDEGRSVESEISFRR